MLTGTDIDDKIRTRVNELMKSAVSVRRMKLVCIGRGGVGKTCLVDRLQGKHDFTDDNPATDGVGVSTLQFEVPGRSKAEASVKACRQHVCVSMCMRVCVLAN